MKVGSETYTDPYYRTVFKDGTALDHSYTVELYATHIAAPLSDCPQADFCTCGSFCNTGNIVISRYN